MLRNRPYVGLIEVKRAGFRAYELTLSVFPSRKPAVFSGHLRALSEQADGRAERIGTERDGGLREQWAVARVAGAEAPVLQWSNAV
ncbi:hypothetical protein [Streptomyces sp. 2A115]|uniref:hypothetical protein n=1 Tax=Streptomyces sp. 2A115 TaxID=3457439 RepID=UPI003FD25D46